MFRLRSHVNIQTILRLDRIQENHQNVAKQKQNTEYQINKQIQADTDMLHFLMFCVTAGAEIFADKDVIHFRFAYLS